MGRVPPDEIETKVGDAVGITLQPVPGRKVQDIVLYDYKNGDYCAIYGPYETPDNPDILVLIVHRKLAGTVEEAWAQAVDKDDSAFLSPAAWGLGDYKFGASVTLWRPA